MSSTSDLPRPAYRPDIDGLRAIAVLLVVFHHLEVPGFPGGFVGIDIFFAISGYLIGGLILRERHAGTFSFAQFYERRSRSLCHDGAYRTVFAYCKNKDRSNAQR